MKYPPEVVEAALYEVAACGNNVARACQVLKDRGVTQAYPADNGRALPRDVVAQWVKGRFRNRYHEIVSTQARELQEVVAAKGIDIALQIGEAELQALRQTTAGLSDATAVEASMILRNLGQSKAVQIDKAKQIRDVGIQEKTANSLDEIVKGLRALNLLDDDDVHDAEVVEDEEETPSLPAG